MTATDLGDWTRINSTTMSTPEHSSSTSSLLSSSSSIPSKPQVETSHSPSNDELNAPKEDPKGFYKQHRTVEERFQVAVLPYVLEDSSKPVTSPTHRRTAVQRGLESSKEALGGLIIMTFFAYLFCKLFGIEFKLPSSLAEPMSIVAAQLWRLSSWWVTFPIKILKTLFGIFDGYRERYIDVTYRLMYAATRYWYRLTGLGFLAFFAVHIVVPPLLLVIWSVTLHEWSILKLLPANLVSPPVAYTVDHLLLLSPILALARYLPSCLGPFTHPLIAYPLLTLYLASAALDCSIPEVFNYPFNRFERILAEHRRQLKEQMFKGGEAEGKGTGVDEKMSPVESEEKVVFVEREGFPY